MLMKLPPGWRNPKSSPLRCIISADGKYESATADLAMNSIKINFGRKL